MRPSCSFTHNELKERGVLRAEGLCLEEMPGKAQWLVEGVSVSSSLRREWGEERLPFSPQTLPAHPHLKVPVSYSCPGSGFRKVYGMLACIAPGTVQLHQLVPGSFGTRASVPRLKPGSSNSYHPGLSGDKVRFSVWSVSPQWVPHKCSFPLPTAGLCALQEEKEIAHS